MNATANHKIRNLTMVAVVVLALVVALGIRFRQLGENEALASIRSVQQEQGIPVETVTAERADLATWITMAGTVAGTVQYPVVSNNALQVVGIPVSEGDRVAKGDVIIRLASGAPSPMYHSVEKSRANYTNALLNAQRLRNLYAEGAVSRAELDAAETSLKVLAADLQDAEGSTALTAGEPGVVSSIMITEGETVKTGTPLAWITDTAQVKIKFTAGSAQALALAPGQQARWTTPEGEMRQGAVSQLDLMADPKTHLLAGESLFANPEGRLVPGLLVSFQVRTHLREDVLTLPEACLVKRDSQSFVWVADSTAKLTPVVTGLKTADRVEITSGLQEGQTVVLHGQTMLSEGVKIMVTGQQGSR